MQQYKNQDKRNYTELLQDIKDMNEINNNLNKLLFDQDQQLHNIETVSANTFETTNQTNKELDIASSNIFRLKPIIIGGLLGASIFGPVGLILGAKGASFYIAGGGCLIGSIVGKKLS